MLQRAEGSLLHHLLLKLYGMTINRQLINAKRGLGVTMQRAVDYLGTGCQRAREQRLCKGVSGMHQQSIGDLSQLRGWRQQCLLQLDPLINHAPTIAGNCTDDKRSV